MRHQTAIRIEQAWRSIPNDHLFDDYEHFFEIAEQLGEVSGDGSDWFYSRRFADSPIGPDNFKLVHVVESEDWDRVLHPAI